MSRTPAKICEERNKSIVEVSSTGKYSRSEVAKMFGLSPATISSVCNKAGIKFCDVKRQHRIDLAYKYLEDGGKMSSMKKDLGFPSTALYEATNGEGIWKELKAKSLENEQLEHDAILQQIIEYIRCGHTREEAAAAFGLSLGTVFRWIRGKGVPGKYTKHD